jgi:hypothetical protein
VEVLVGVASGRGIPKNRSFCSHLAGPATSPFLITHPLRVDPYRRKNMFYPNPEEITCGERLQEIADILSKGYLRLLLSKKEKKRSNCLNNLDLSAKERHELDRELTPLKNRRECLATNNNQTNSGVTVHDRK